MSIKNHALLVAKLLTAILVPLSCLALDSERSDDAEKIVRDAVEYLRGETSYSKSEMKVIREDWTRSMAFESWTRGTNRSLVKFTSPVQDRGNATLTVEDDVWTYSPKTSKTIKLPATMKAQSWMGSDFSYQDLTRDDEIIESYSHKVVGKEQDQGQEVWVIEAIPKEDSPIVWGKEVLKIRADHLIIGHLYYDQDFKLVKKLTAVETAQLGGKLMVSKFRMQTEDTGNITEVTHNDLKFNVNLSEQDFSKDRLASH